MRKGNLFVISGPSGAGKGTIVARLMERVADAWLSISATTRAPRTGEEDGVHYLFLSHDQFDELIQNDGLLEWANVHGNKYGTPRALVEERMAAGQQVILEIDVQGGFQVRDVIPDAHLVFIEPPSLEILEERLRGRGTDSEESIVLRMRNAELELSRKMEYDIQFVNDNLDECTDAVVAFIERQAQIDEEN
jgi:guanylate kinase